MQLGMIGLGRMGANMVVRMMKAGHDCHVYDTHAEAVEALTDKGATGSTDLGAFLKGLDKPRAVWMMVPAAVVDAVIAELAPLLEAGMDKESVRIVADSFGLPVGSKPAAACLASRIPSGTEVTEGRLRSVESAEEALKELGFGQVRVRGPEWCGRSRMPAFGSVRWTWRVTAPEASTLENPTTAVRPWPAANKEARHGRPHAPSEYRLADGCRN